MRKHCSAVLAAVVAMAAAVILAAFPAYAHDIEWGIRHGEQDALVLGTVKEAGEDWVLLEDVIPLPCDNTTAIYRLLEPDQIPETMKVVNVQPYTISYHNKTRAKAGDHMMVSTDRDGDRWKALYRPYEVSSMDTATLEFLPEGRKTRDGAAWEAFVNSGGAYSEFAFGDGRVYVQVKQEDGTEEKVVLFEEPDKTEEGAAEPRIAEAAEPDKTEEEAAEPRMMETGAEDTEAQPDTGETVPVTTAPATTVAASAPSSTSSIGISPLAMGFLWGGVGFVAAFVFSRRK